MRLRGWVMSSRYLGRERRDPASVDTFEGSDRRRSRNGNGGGALNPGKIVIGLLVASLTFLARDKMDSIRQDISTLKASHATNDWVDAVNRHVQVSEERAREYVPRLVTVERDLLASQRETNLRMNGIEEMLRELVREKRRLARGGGRDATRAAPASGAEIAPPGGQASTRALDAPLRQAAARR